MAEITKSVRDTFGVMADLVRPMRKQISQQEFTERLAYAAELSRKSHNAVDPVARKSYANRARGANRSTSSGRDQG